MDPVPAAVDPAESRPPRHPLLPAAVAGAVAFVAIVTACTAAGLFFRRPMPHAAGNAYYALVAAVATLQAFAALRFLHRGGHACRHLVFGLTAVGAVNGAGLLLLGKTALGITQIAVSLPLAVALLMPDAEKYVPGITLRRHAVRAVRLMALVPAILAGAAGLVFPLGYGSLESQGRAIDERTALLFRNLRPLIDDSDAKEPPPQLAAALKDAAAELADIQKEAQYLWSCGEKFHAARAYLRASMLLVELARFSVSDISEYAQRVFLFDDAVDKTQMAAAARPDLFSGEFADTWDRAVKVYGKTPNIVR